MIRKIFSLATSFFRGLTCLLVLCPLSRVSISTLLAGFKAVWKVRTSNWTHFFVLKICWHCSLISFLSFKCHVSLLKEFTVPVALGQLFTMVQWKFLMKLQVQGNAELEIWCCNTCEAIALLMTGQFHFWQFNLLLPVDKSKRRPWG